MNILLLEDDLVDVEVFERTLQSIENSSFELKHVDSLKAALTSISEAPPDIIFADLNVGDASGLETVSTLFEANPNLPLVVLTGLKDNDMLRKVLSLGAQDYIVKGLLPPDAMNRCIYSAIIRKETEQGLIQRNENKNHFLANISHEMRTPLNAFIGICDELREDKDSGINKSHLEVMHRTSNDLLRLVNEILDIAKIETGKLFIGMEHTNLKVLIQSVLVDVGIIAKRNNVKVEFDWDQALCEQVVLDAMRVRQVLINLLSNAIKFSPGKSVKIKVVGEGKTISFNVIDSGKGIRPERVEKIFDSFIQENFSTTRQYGGTGLGLTISKSLVQLMGGHIGVDSKLGIGSRFYFSLPLIPSTDIRHSPEEGQANSTSPLWGDILIVDDVADNQYLLNVFLKKTDLKAEFASNGEEAVRMAKEKSFDLILMDMQMPVMDGYEATKQIREYEKRRQRTAVPIIALTANAYDTHKAGTEAVGCNDFMSKPIRKKDLLQLLKKTLSKDKKSAA